MHRKSKIVIIAATLISAVWWNTLNDAKADNYRVKDEPTLIKKQVSDYKKWTKVNPKLYRVERTFVIDGETVD